MSRYGSDRPDTRFDLQLKDVNFSPFLLLDLILTFKIKFSNEVVFLLCNVCLEPMTVHWKMKPSGFCCALKAVSYWSDLSNFLLLHYFGEYSVLFYLLNLLSSLPFSSCFIVHTNLNDFRIF